MTRAVLFVALASLIVSLSISANPPDTAKKEKSPKGGGGSVKLGAPTGFIQEKDYTLFVPHSYKESNTKSYPLILFLHGQGQVKKPHGPPEDVPGLGPHIREHEKSFPFFVIFPRGAHDGGWFKDSKPLDATRALDILRTVQKEYTVIDEKRLYLTGVSGGAHGVWELAAEHPELWAALVPLSGGPTGGMGNAKPGSKESIDAAVTFAKYAAPKIRDIPVWCFHEKSDGVAGVEWTEKLAAELRAKSLKPGEAPPRSGLAFLTLFDDCGSNLVATAHEQCWRNAFSDAKATSDSDEKENLYHWLLKHHRK